MNQLLVGIDLGTSSVKAVVADAAGQIKGRAAAETRLLTPAAGQVEQDPREWVHAALQAVHLAVKEAGARPGEVAAIGFSGQMHGLVCVDSAGQAIRPAILWADQRSAAHAQAVEARIGLPRLAEWTGNRLAAGFQLASWLWVRQHEPETAHRTRHLLLPKDYLRLQLGGILASEPSDACATGMFDSRQRVWSRELLAALDLDETLLPPLLESADLAGMLNPYSAHQCGLLSGTPLAAGAGDQAAQALGNGILAPGQISCTIGTGGQLLAPLAAPAPDSELRLHHFCQAVPQGWYLMAATLAAGLSLRWLRDQIFEGLDYTALADLAAGVPDAAGVFFLPHLAGERTPYMDPEAHGAFSGLALRHNRAHLVRAVMEGVCFSLRLGLEVMKECGVLPQRLAASGGARQHPLWLRLMADIFGLPVTTTHAAEAAAQGAALLGGAAVGVYQDARTAALQLSGREKEIIQPDPARVEYYNRTFETFKKLYPALKSV